MQTSTKASILICLYGLFKAFRPIEPFYVPYLTSPPINLSNEVIDNVLNPQWTYAYLTLLIPVFIITDLLRYRLVIFVEALALLADTATLLWGWQMTRKRCSVWRDFVLCTFCAEKCREVIGLNGMRFATFSLHRSWRTETDFLVENWVFAVGSATEVAYYSYIYSVIPEELYQKVTAYVRAVLFAGRFGESFCVVLFVVKSSRESVDVCCDLMLLSSLQPLMALGNCCMNTLSRHILLISSCCIRHSAALQCVCL